MISPPQRELSYLRSRGIFFPTAAAVAGLVLVPYRRTLTARNKDKNSGE